MSHTARTLVSVLRSAWRRPKPQLERVPQDSVKLYEQIPPAWARWALVLVSVDVMVATSAVDIIWNAWTMPDPAIQKDSESEAKLKLEEKKGNRFQIIPPGHVLVPAWKRALSSSLFIVVGIAVAGSILASRSRIIRSISYARASKENPGLLPPSRIYLQTASHPLKFGNTYAVKDCQLLPSSEDQMMLEIKDQGKWVLDVRGAKIASRPAPQNKKLARSMILQRWKAIEGPIRPFS